MNILHRPGAARGHADHGWLDARHTFAFADYWDPDWTGFHGLRVLNEDTVAPGTGFPTHGHRDMEIITWPLAGRLRHQDSLGHGAELVPGTVQVMSAGRGIRHSEVNPDREQPLRLLQIWIEPTVLGAPPRYADRAIAPADRAGRWAVLAAAEGSPAHAAGALPIRSPSQVQVADLAPGQELAYALAPGRAAWVQVAHGALTVAGAALAAGDALGIEPAPTVQPLVVRAVEAAQVLLFDLP